MQIERLTAWCFSLGGQENRDLNGSSLAALEKDMKDLRETAWVTAASISQPHLGSVPRKVQGITNFTSESEFLEATSFHK